ncbi:MAG: DNA repair protein RadC [Gammaproteobacteria bacterium]|nr:DNA repair protein RadC [Gammaproteobacteria bacterium]
MKIRDWVRSERPREKLAERGADALSDAELLAIVLRTGTAGTNAMDLARGVLNRYGGLRRTLDLGLADLQHTPGLGLSKAASLVAALELARRYFAEDIKRGTQLQSPRDTAQFLSARMRNYPNEVFACLFLDTRHRVICFEEMFRGTINCASVHPREVVKRALSHNAAAVILAHNHPSGMTEPSESDAAITRQLKDALELIDVRVLDHFVIGDGAPASLAEYGLM